VFASTRLLHSLLFGIGATDLRTMFIVTLILSVVAFLACLLPARRATRVDPVQALRAE
jgi:ABC-type lipoprotein release transport system permease subunit